jgi:hypothetical protein
VVAITLYLNPCLRVSDSVSAIIDQTTIEDLIERDQEIVEERSGGFLMAGI